MPYGEGDLCVGVLDKDYHIGLNTPQMLRL
jgi:hypothetical protein